MQKKERFFDFESDKESITEDTVELEASAYLSNAKKIDCLHKYPILKIAISKVQY